MNRCRHGLLVGTCATCRDADTARSVAALLAPRRVACPRCGWPGSASVCRPCYRIDWPGFGRDWITEGLEELRARGQSVEAWVTARRETWHSNLPTVEHADHLRGVEQWRERGVAA